jgi:hypothetical protein
MQVMRMPNNENQLLSKQILFEERAKLFMARTNELMEMVKLSKTK